MTTPSSASASTSPLSRKYRSLVWSFLDCDLPRTALFYAERYYFTDQSNHDARHLLATGLLRCQQVHSAQNLVAAGGCVGCSEIFAQCCMKLGRYRQGEDALASCLGKARVEPQVSEPRTMPDESVYLCQAGAHALKSNMPDRAAQHFLKALSLNPFLWEAIDGLCQIGQCPEIDALIRSGTTAPLQFFPPPHVRFDGPSMKSSTSSNGFIPIPQPSGTGFFTPLPDVQRQRYQQPSFGGYNGPTQPFRLEPLQQDTSMNGSLASMMDSPYSGELASFPALNGGNHSGVSSSAATFLPTHTNNKVADDITRTSHKRTRAQMASGTAVVGTNALPKIEKKPSRGAAEGALAVFRRSTRLLGGANKNSVKAPPRDKRRTARTRSKSRDPDDMDEDMQPIESATSSTSSPREFSPAPAPPSAPPPVDEIQIASNTILDLTRRFAKAVRCLSLYDAQGTLDAIAQLPPEQMHAPWVSTLVGRARFEMAEYVQASRAFEQARVLDPYRMWDMDVYSTVLWHLQEDVKLSFVAQELVSIDEQSAQAWIATGNCFSLQKDHSQALTCFKRATQLDARCAYGFALSGHEALALDDHDSALQFFRTALKTDARHYPAWYGLGTVYLKQNKLRKAEYHFRKAVEISPSNAVLISCEGTALEKRGALEEALERFNRSLALSPKSALVRFKRVKVLIQLKQYETALKDLLDLRDLSPDEANVPFLLGKLYREMGRNVDATGCFTIARDLDPKLSAIIGHLMEDMS